MIKDRSKIRAILNDLLNVPDAPVFSQRAECVDKLEAYIEEVRNEALGWMLAECCTTLDSGGDPRKKEVPEMLGRAISDLGD